MGNDGHVFEGHLSNPVLSTDFRAFVKDVEQKSSSCRQGTLWCPALCMNIVSWQRWSWSMEILASWLLVYLTMLIKLILWHGVKRERDHKRWSRNDLKGIDRGLFKSSIMEFALLIWGNPRKFFVKVIEHSVIATLPTWCAGFRKLRPWPMKYIDFWVM